MNIYIPPSVGRELKKERAALELELLCSEFYKTRYLPAPSEMSDDMLKFWVDESRKWVKSKTK